MSETAERYPLFLLELVLLPGEVLPLHVFEERYKLMIGECLEQGSQFGIVWMGDGGLSDVGCSAEIAQLVEKLEDGRMNLLVRGTRPFRLDRRVDDMPYPAGDVVLLADIDEAVDAEAGATARRSYADLVQRVTDSRPSETDLEQLDAYEMASTIAFELEAKQELLELRSESERMQRLAELCAEALERVEYTQQASERAQGNGRVPH